MKFNWHNNIIPPQAPYYNKLKRFGKESLFFLNSARTLVTLILVGCQS
nr:MAG TPA: hypothetical protein [Caudoviricetes sp.]